MPSKLISIYRTLRKSYGPQHWWPARTPFEVIVGAILTQNTAWENVALAIKNLRNQKLLSFRQISQATAASIARAIRPAGYFRIKTKYLQNFLDLVKKETGGSVKKLLRLPLPNLREKLLQVKGIGPETADSILLYAARRPIFVVDAYTKRIFARLGFLSPDSSYEDVQRFFMRVLPASERFFNEYHALIVKHAKEFCRKKPGCLDCPLSLQCPYPHSHHKAL